MNTFALVRKAKQEEGAALLTAVVILLALTIMGFAMILVTKVDLMVSRNFRLAEEAVYAAEEGSLAAMVMIDKSYLDLSPGDTLSPNDAYMEMPSHHPKWDFLATKEGYAPRAGRSSLEVSGQQVNYYQYRIQSQGYSRARAQRTVEVLVRVKQIESGGSGSRRIAAIY